MHSEWALTIFLILAVCWAVWLLESVKRLELLEKNNTMMVNLSDRTFGRIGDIDSRTLGHIAMQLHRIEQQLNRFDAKLQIQTRPMDDLERSLQEEVRKARDP